MNNIANQIRTLINSKGQSAPKITSGLANIGNGNMQDGIKRIAEFQLKTGLDTGTKAGIRTGTVRGAIGTTIIIVVLGGIGYIVYDKTRKSKKEKALRAEGKAILKGLEESIIDYQGTDFDDNDLEDIKLHIKKVRSNRKVGYLKLINIAI